MASKKKAARGGRTTAYTLRLTPKERQAIERAAALDQRPASGWIRMVVLRAIGREGV